MNIGKGCSYSPGVSDYFEGPRPRPGLALDGKNGDKSLGSTNLVVPVGFHINGSEWVCVFLVFQMVDAC